MWSMTPNVTTDPLAAFAAGAFESGRGRPIPLLSTSFDVHLSAGLAIVETTRRFRNAEEVSIEATITFPIPVHATLFNLEARIDDRVLKARARRRSEAREAYEDALERGKTAVLHEEVLRGVHMLSIGHIPAGGAIEVRAAWAATLSVVGGEGRLRIPLTVGDIYGRSGLPDADDLIHGGDNQIAELTVRCDDGAVSLGNAILEGVSARVALNAPIDLTVAAWPARTLFGHAADGRSVSLQVEPAPAGDAALDVAILVDRSGSMGEAVGSGRRTKHDALVSALRSSASLLRGGDAVDLWEFDDSIKHVGSTAGVRSRLFRLASEGGRLLSLVRHLNGPGGGTEIGKALGDVLERSAARDIVLVTDGKSHALDVQALAQAGRRITVVLVGGDSLEANVGHLAALTGGDIFVAAGADLGDTIGTALASLRGPATRPEAIEGDLHHAMARRGNAIVSASWGSASAGAFDERLGRAVAAVAASIALPVLDAEAAADLAEAEGLVTHLTSLIMIDEAGEVQDGVPATRKIALPSPNTVVYAFALPADTSVLLKPPKGQALSASVGFAEDDDLLDLPAVATQIDWDTAPNDLIAGDLGRLPPRLADWILAASRRPDVMALAVRLKLDPLLLVVALLALSAADAHRSAGRIAAAILGDRLHSPDIAGAAILFEGSRRS